jgi:transcriptional regulator with XRE-family HTH domain
MAPIHRLAKTLKRLRAARGLSQEALARKARISRGYLARLETARQDPTLGVLARLAKALGVSVGTLVE